MRNFYSKYITKTLTIQFTMSLKCGIVGLPNVGKSTLFNCLTNGNAASENFPFCTIEPNVGVVPIADSRLNMLTSMVSPQKTIPAYVEFVDIAGLVEGASKGEGLGNKFLANIREVDAIVHVVRCFKNENIQHVAGRVDPIADKGIIDCELQLKDLETVQKRLQKVEKGAKAGDKLAKQECDLLKKVEETLLQGKNIRDNEDLKNDYEIINSWQLLTIKPVIYLANIDEACLSSKNEYLKNFENEISKENHVLIPICIALEDQLAKLDSDEKSLFLQEYGIKESAIDFLTRTAYSALGLITYFTVGVQEVRAWTIKNGFTAPQAAGVIHTDFERGFIKAEVIKYQDFIHYKSEQACKDAGKLKIEGKAYIVCDGDIMHFRFNV